MRSVLKVEGQDRHCTTGSGKDFPCKFKTKVHVESWVAGSCGLYDVGCEIGIVVQ